MGQHLFTHPAPDGRMLDIMLGYDPVLNYFFLDVEPVIDIPSNQDVAFDSILWSVQNKQKSPGFDYLGKMSEKVAELGIVLPKGLLLRLDDQQKQPHLYPRNEVLRWPLQGKAKREHERWLDKQIITSVLSNNDAGATDEELLEVLKESVTTVVPHVLFRIIVEQEPKLRLDFTHRIPFYNYLDDAHYIHTEPGA